MPINRFRGKYMFLSNFCSCKHGVEFEGQIYPTSEHAYQAAKIENPTGRDSFVVGGSLGNNPMDAKRKGGKGWSLSLLAGTEVRFFGGQKIAKIKKLTDIFGG